MATSTTTPATPATPTTQQTHTAAAAEATPIRAEVKEDWWKNPVALNVAVAIGVILAALIINTVFEFNFFWKLLVGGVLINIGAKMAAVKTGPIKLWGKIFRGLGWAIIIIALLNSGMRLALEKSVIWADRTLTNLAEGNKAGDEQQMPATIYTEVDMREVLDSVMVPVTIPINEGVTIIMPRRETSKVVRLCSRLPDEIRSDLNRPHPWHTTTTSHGGVKQHIVANDEMRAYMKSQEKLVVRFYLNPGTGPCP